MELSKLDDVESKQKITKVEIENAEAKIRAQERAENLQKNIEIKSPYQINDIHDKCGGVNSIWHDGNQGIHYEQLYGANIGGNFPTIDDFDRDTGMATSLKTIDLNAPSYNIENPNGLNHLQSVIERYTNKLDNFAGRTWNMRVERKGIISQERIEILKDEIAMKKLVIGIPKGSVNLENMKILEKCQASAAKRNIQLNYEEVP